MGMTFKEARDITGKDKFCIWIEDFESIAKVVDFFDFNPEEAWDWFDSDDIFPCILTIITDEDDDEPVFNWSDDDLEEIEEYKSDEDYFYVVCDELELAFSEENLLERKIKQEIGL